MRRIMILLLTFVVVFSSFVFPSFGVTSIADIGGFDFYSITFHYSEPVVVNYVEKEKEYVDEKGRTKTESYYVFGEPVDSYTIYVTENADNQLITSLNEKEIKRARDMVSGFYSVESGELGIGKTELAYTKYPSPAAYITQIQDNTAIMIKDTGAICGVEDFYDQDNKRNPNFVEENGYFIDAETGNRIDDNGFIIDANNLWHATDGVRIEAFTTTADGTLVWVPYVNRVADGKALANHLVTNSMLIEKGVLPAFPEYESGVDYDGDGRISKGFDKKEYTYKKDRYESDFIRLYRIKTDTDRDGKYSAKELDAVNDINRTFTQNDIETYTNTAAYLSYKRGTPDIGVPKTKASITSVTIEIDALGTQLYSDVALDPQQKNTITLTSGDVYENVKSAKDIVSKNSTKINNIGEIIGSAKCVTTKTSMNLTAGATITKKSVTIDATAESLSVIRNDSSLYLNFNVGTLQPTSGVKIDDTYILSGTTVEGTKPSDKWIASLVPVIVNKITEKSIRNVK